MKIRILLFASFAEEAGFAERLVELPSPSTVRDAWVETLRFAPPLAKWPVPPLIARNRSYARADTPLAEGDELAFLPPIAGG